MGRSGRIDMTGMHLVRIPVETGKLAQWAADRGWSGRRGVSYDEGRALHHLVTEIWGPGAFSCFRLLVPPRRRLGNLYAYSEMSTAALHDAASAHALPEHLEVVSVERLACKAMPKDWRIGQQLGFDLRMRPVRRLSSNLEGPKAKIRAGSEIDAFLLEALRKFPRERDGMSKQDRSRENVYFDWLTDRLTPAATLDRSASRLVRFRRMLAAREKHDSEGPDATVHGILTVESPAEFGALLARGVGRHRAYGYGMLLLRPPSRRVPKQ